VTVSAKGDAAEDDVSIVRAVAAAVWDTQFDGQTPRIEAGDDRARDALQRWSLMQGD
jgi:hypothetical protein